jgi:hypothetical protein
MLVALVLAIGIMNKGSIMAQTPDPTIPTTAVVTGAGTAPVIDCKWELPDMQPGVGPASTPPATTAPDANVQYGTATNAHAHDDDSAVFPTVNPSCAIPVSPANSFPIQPENVRHMIQVRPLSEDKPEERRIQLWVAANHPNGLSNISDVYWKIYHPDGSFKVQVHGARVPVAGCTALGDSTTVGTMFEAAVHTGQLSAAAVDDTNRGFRKACAQNERAFYYATFTLSKHQPCGEYRVEAHAVSSGLEDTQTNYIDILCTYFMNLDFQQVNYGTITPGLSKSISGDFLFSPPNDSFPSIKNTGNTGLGITVNFSPMLQSVGGTPIPGAKIIDQFDICFVESAQFTANPNTLKCIDPILANTPTNLGTARAQTLCSNEIGKVDFSIHPPSTLPAGTYTGTVHITAVDNANICPTDQRLLVPAPPGG